MDKIKPLKTLIPNDLESEDYLFTDACKFLPELRNTACNQTEVGNTYSYFESLGMNLM
jgi:hypothetical protein